MSELDTPHPGDPPPAYSSSLSPNLKPTLRSKPKHRISAAPKTPEVLAREALVRPYLPESPISASTTRRQHGRRLRPLLAHAFHIIIFYALHGIFSLYLLLRSLTNRAIARGLEKFYYHQRTAEMVERDVADLRREGKRFPGHVSVILELKEGARDGESSVERFVREAGDIACWSAAAGVNTLSIYERSGTGKRVASRVREGVESAVRAYFAGRSGKSVSVRAVNAPGEVEDEEEVDLEVLLLSEEDGREAMVDLTKTLCEMAQRGKVQLEEVGQELVDEELKENVMGEPDLLILFSPNVSLQGYPPWQIRLTEIFNVADNEKVTYQVFLRALHFFARTEFKFGR